VIKAKKTSSGGLKLQCIALATFLVLYVLP